jgi:hypothetical protein
MHGVGKTPASGCPFTSVVLSADGDLIRLEITDPSARKSDRTVASADSAATIVESWLQEDPTALAPRTTGDAGEVTPSTAADQPPATAPVPAPAPSIAATAPSAATSGAIPRAYFDLDGVAGIGFDGSGWFGGGVAGCAVLGRVCLGAGAKVGVDPKVGGGSESLDTQRILLDLVALLDVPVRFRGFTLRPGIDLGAAFVRMTRTIHVDEGNEEGDHQDSGGGSWIVQRWELALGAHVTGAISLGKRFALIVGVAVLVLPAADTGAFVRENASLAGVPRGMARGSIGLEYAL